MSLAIIKTGGKQYLVSPGQKIKIEKIDPHHLSEGVGAGKKEDEIVFNEVLLLAYSPSGSARLGKKNKKIEIGTPLLKGVKVIGKILKQGRGKKIVIFKFRHKTRYKVKKGHRQSFTEVEIKDIETEKE